ncbi:MAG: nucleotidyltransferase family protein [Acidobacteriota bacterium]
MRRDSSDGREEIAAFAISSQGLSALVGKARGIEALPDALAEFLSEEISRAGARARRLRSTWEGTVRTLRGAGVEVIALKGAALAFFHYPDPALRPMGDLDLLLVDPRDLGRATDALDGASWRALLDTPRHRVFAREGERVVRPAAEDPDNPIRIEIHTTFRLRVLGHVYDADEVLRADAEKRDLDGTPVAIAAGPAFLTHLLFHATGDYAGIGIRGVQAYDFRLLARARGALAPEISANERENARAPLLFAADAIERLFPLAFKEEFLSSLSSSVPSDLRRRAAALPALRYTRPPRGWSRTLLTLIDGPLPKARFLARTLFPTLGEVKANAAPDSSGLALARAWLRVFGRRLAAVARWGRR